MKTGVIEGGWDRKSSPPPNLCALLERVRKSNLAAIKAAKTSLSEAEKLQLEIEAIQAAIERQWAKFERDVKAAVKAELGIKPPKPPRRTTGRTR